MGEVVKIKFTHAFENLIKNNLDDYGALCRFWTLGGLAEPIAFAFSKDH